MTKKKAYFPIFLGVAIVIGIFIGSTFNYQNKTVLFNSNSSEAKIKRLINYIHYDYVDEVDTDSLLDDAITNMLGKLDPHSVYIPKDELQQVTESMQGKFVGIGVSFLMHQDSVVVSSIIKGGPSESSGLLEGDRILIADKDTLFGESILHKAGILKTEKGSFRGNRKISDAVMKALKGEPETEVNLTIYRRSTDETIQIPITRGEVSLTSVNGHYMINNTLGYINVDRFARTTYDEFHKALDSLISQGMTALILDLRGNPGGFMDIAESIVDEFLGDGKLIVFTKNKTGEVDKYYTSSDGDFEDGTVYVLIDQNSASASEIVSGALQDNDRGTIVGRRSFGKGLVQQEMSLGDGSAIRLTTSRYYTPTGRSIQKPYDQHNSKAYENDYIDRIKNGELLSKDSIKVNQALKFTTPKGKIVYGGGGIIPDVFVPIDTLNRFKTSLYGPLNNFVFNYVDSHRDKLNKWELNDFVKNFDANNGVFKEYESQLDLKTPMIDRDNKNLKIYLKALIARSIFGENGYLMVAQQTDLMISKVLELENERIK